MIGLQQRICNAHFSQNAKLGSKTIKHSSAVAGRPTVMRGRASAKASSSSSSSVYFMGIDFGTSGARVTVIDGEYICEDH
jgi:hypothetical protein